jgi:hypothetical protein
VTLSRNPAGPGKRSVIDLLSGAVLAFSLFWLVSQLAEGLEACAVTDRRADRFKASATYLLQT